MKRLDSIFGFATILTHPITVKVELDPPTPPPEPRKPPWWEKALTFLDLMLGIKPKEER